MPLPETKQALEDYVRYCEAEIRRINNKQKRLAREAEECTTLLKTMSDVNSKGV